MASLFAKFTSLISQKEDTEEKEEEWRPPTIYDIPQTTFQRIMVFLVYDKPGEMVKMRLVNKYFYNLFDIDYGGTNFLWKMVCQNRFKHISPKWTTKRWDKLYQIRLLAMHREFEGGSLRSDYLNVNQPQDIEDIAIEGCSLGLPASQKLGAMKKLKLKTGMKTEGEILAGLKFNDILVRNSLIEDGQIWFIQCPILQSKENRNFDRRCGDEYKSLEEWEMRRKAIEYEHELDDDQKELTPDEREVAAKMVNDGLIVGTNWKNINYCAVCSM